MAVTEHVGQPVPRERFRLARPQLVDASVVLWRERARHGRSRTVVVAHAKRTKTASEIVTPLPIDARGGRVSLVVFRARGVSLLPTKSRRVNIGTYGIPWRGSPRLLHSGRPPRPATTSNPSALRLSTARSVEPPVVTVSSKMMSLAPGASLGSSTSRPVPCLGLNVDGVEGPMFERRSETDRARQGQPPAPPRRRRRGGPLAGRPRREAPVPPADASAVSTAGLQSMKKSLAPAVRRTFRVETNVPE